MGGDTSTGAGAGEIGVNEGKADEKRDSEGESEARRRGGGGCGGEGAETGGEEHVETGVERSVLPCLGFIVSVVLLGAGWRPASRERALEHGDAVDLVPSSR